MGDAQASGWNRRHPLHVLRGPVGEATSTACGGCRDGASLPIREQIHRTAGKHVGDRSAVAVTASGEVCLREGRRFTALRLSGLPHRKGRHAFDFAVQPDLDTRKVRDRAGLLPAPARRSECRDQARGHVSVPSSRPAW